MSSDSSSIPNNEKDQFKRIQNRLETTSNDKLESVINSLLPKIIPMLQGGSSIVDGLKQETMDTHIMPILDIAYERILSVQDIKLPVLELLQLIQFKNAKIVCDTSIKFVDIVVTNQNCRLHSTEYINDMCRVIVSSLIEFPVNSFQSHSLCYYAYKLLDKCVDICMMSKATTDTPLPPSLSSLPVPSTAISLTSITAITSVLGDWFFDLSLLQNVVIKDAVGSITPGLSVDRLNRMTCKRTQWNLVDIKSLKLSLIKTFSKPWLLPCHIIPILLSFVCGRPRC